MLVRGAERDRGLREEGDPGGRLRVGRKERRREGTRPRSEAKLSRENETDRSEVGEEAQTWRLSSCGRVGAEEAQRRPATTVGSREARVDPALGDFLWY